MQNSIIIQNVSADELKQLISQTVKEALPHIEQEEKQPEYITRKEAARVLQISLVTLDKWSELGYIQKYRVGTRIRFKLSEVNGAMEQVKNLKYRRGE